MSDGRPNLPWPGVDERAVVKAMLRNGKSDEWRKCREFVMRYVQVRAKNIPQDRWEDIVQDAMIRIIRLLPYFRFDCSFKSWLFNITLKCIIDAYRRYKRAGKTIVPLSDTYDDTEPEGEMFSADTFPTVEEESIIREELIAANAALQEHIAAHAKTDRNRRILDMVFNEGRSHKEAAQAIGCSAAVVGYVVRTAQRYVREMLEHRRQTRRSDGERK